MIANLQAKWQEIEQAKGPAERLRRALPDKDLPVYVTYDPSTRQRGLRIVVPGGGPLGGIPRWREVDIRQESDSAAWAVHLRLQHERFQVVFAALAGDVVAALRSHEQAHWSKVLRDRIQVWHQFFREHGFRGLSQEQQRGLFGELVVLRDLVLARLPATEAVSRWTGPRGRPHDFELPGGDVEVKTTTPGEPTVVRINGVQQLDSAGRNLFLHTVTLEEGEDGQSLPTLVASVRQALAAEHDSAHRLEQRLQEAGYLDVHAEEYGTLLRVTGQATYRVDGNFPRIVTVPDAIRDMRYHLHLAGCGRYRTDTNAAFDSTCGVEA